MKRSDIKHILDTYAPDEELVFTKYLNQITGMQEPPPLTASQWGHVRHICGNLYFAWDDGEEESGAVYLGEWRKKEDDR